MEDGKPHSVKNHVKTEQVTNLIEDQVVISLRHAPMRGDSLIYHENEKLKVDDSPYGKCPSGGLDSKHVVLCHPDLGVVWLCRKSIDVHVSEECKRVKDLKISSLAWLDHSALGRYESVPEIHVL